MTNAMHEEQNPPICTYCQQHAVLVTGATIYPHRTDLADKYFWQCAPCDAYVGTHAGTKNPYGTLASKELRRARMRLHDEVIDPLWRGAPECGAYEIRPGDKRAVKKIQKSARPRVYAFLANKLGLSIKHTHAGMFTLEQCRAARSALKGVTFLEIREWSLAQVLPPQRTEC